MFSKMSQLESQVEELLNSQRRQSGSTTSSDNPTTGNLDSTEQPHTDPNHENNKTFTEPKNDKHNDSDLSIFADKIASSMALLMSKPAKAKASNLL